ncbi:MAG TPA: UPF0182 family protein [Acidimicrobiia bacterium]|nr:UPF0182 family protein [Acidimicrobiia bacterium]
MLNREPTEITPRPRRRRGLGVILVIVAAVLLALRTLAGFWTDYLWFQSIDLVSVWSTRFWTTAAIVVVASLIAFGFLFGNLILADRLSPRFRLIDLGDDEEVVERFSEWIEPRIRRVRLLLALVFGVMLGVGTASLLDQVLAFLNSSSFGVTDPQFGIDVGFYVFRLPFWRELVNWTFQLVVASAILVTALHYLNGGIRLRQGRPPEIGEGVRAHLSVLFALLAILKAGAYRIDGYELLNSSRGLVFGAGYTDVNARIPALQLLVWISLAAALLLLYNLRRRGWMLPAVAVGSWLAVSLIVGNIIPAAVQRFQVDPNEIERELPYIGRTIEFTRNAFGLADVEVRSFAAAQQLDADAIEANRPTIDNLRLWDPTVLESTYRQLQELRTFYKFEDVDIDRYEVDGELTQVMLSARELDLEGLEVTGWVNEHLVFTHGFGAVLSPANSVTVEGQPDFFVKDIPPETTVAGLEVTSPRIYFGEGLNSGSFVIVGTNEKEVDFPLGAGESAVEFNSYDGEGGVRVGNIFRRAAFALRFGDFNTLIAQQLTNDSKVLMVRNITDRVTTAAPFLIPDGDPYMVALDGRLIWMIDTYTVTDRFPYSEPSNTARLGAEARLPFGLNYVRNSVKVAVDAFDGTMTFYVVDPSDPIIQTYQKIYPDLFADFDQMPDGMVAHLRYPEDMFRIQSDVYSLYHVTEPRVFINNGDPWAIARDPSTTVPEQIRIESAYRDADDALYRPMLPYYLLMRLPEEEGLSFILMQPFTPANRPNMSSFLVAKSGPDNYGQLIDYELPRDRLVDGPGQVGVRINQDPEISPEFTLLGQEGSVVIQGSMLVVPIEDSVLYVQPIYLQGEDRASALPEFKRVVVVFDDRIVMRETLDEAMSAIFEGYVVPGGDTVTPPGTGDDLVVPSDVADLLRQADAAFAEAQAALSAGDLGGYQAKIDEAQQLIGEAIELLSNGG